MLFVKLNMKLNIRIDEILNKKDRVVFTINKDQTVYDALKIMEEKEIGALPVLDERGKVVGIFSERDYARKCILKGKHSKETMVEELMTSKVYFLTLEDKVEEAMALMTEKKVRHLPVLEGEKLIGIISIGDLVKTIIEEQKFIIKNLERYIIGG